MPLYKSLKFTTPLILALFIILSVIGLQLVNTKISEETFVEMSGKKNIELSHKLAHDIEMVLKFSDSFYDINDMLMSYLIGDINYISAYKNGKSYYKSFYNIEVEGREKFIFSNYKKVIKENIAHIHYNKDKNLFQSLIRYTIPKQKNEIVPRNFGVIYYEYSLERDGKVLMQQNRQRFMISLVWGMALLIFLSVFIIQKFVRPIVKLSDATKKLSDKSEEFHGLNYASVIKDEIYILFNSFNEMSAKLKNSKLALNNINKTLLQQTKEAQQASKAKSDFLANMSHEIRTPLNAIVGFIQLLKKKETDLEKRRYLSIIDASSSGLTNVINDILDLSKIESGKMDIVLEDFSLSLCIKNIIDLYKAKADEKNINFVVSLSSTLPSAIHTDELRLKQIIGNLLSNAIKFTPEFGNVTIVVVHDNTTLKIEVIDSGIGIEEERQEKIFDAFTQSNELTAKDYGGTGLGLTIVNKLIDMLNGKITLESELGKGSTFTIEISAPTVTRQKEQVADAEEIYLFNGEKILLVEDNKTNQLFATIILDEFNLTYDVANNGQEAVELFKEHKYALILMDENMPIMNGTEATKAILEIEKSKDLKHTPIIALTANALKGDRERFVEAGMDEYVSKPIDTHQLANIIRKLISQDRD